MKITLIYFLLLLPLNQPLNRERSTEIKNPQKPRDLLPLPPVAMMVSRGLFGWSPPHIQPLTPVSEVSEPPESPSPYLDPSAENGGGGGAGMATQAEEDEEMDEPEEMEPPPAAVPFSQLFACADRFDWVLMVLGSVAAAAHGAALIVYLHYFAKIVQVLAYGTGSGRRGAEDQFDRLVEVSSACLSLWMMCPLLSNLYPFLQLSLTIVYIAGGVFISGWIGRFTILIKPCCNDAIS